MAVAITQTANPAGVSASSNVATYSSVSIGTAASNRVVVVAVGSELGSTPINSCTIDYGTGDTSMTAGSAGNLNSLYARLFYLLAPTGTTATIKVTFGTNSPSNTQNHIAVYSVTGSVFSSSGNDGSTDMDATDPLTTGSITIPTNGGFIAVASGATDGTAKTWTNATEDIDADAGLFRFTTATRTTALTTTAVTCMGGTNGEDGALSYIIFTDNTSPTVALNTPADAATGVSVTPTLEFTGTDTEGDSVRYNIQIDTVNTFDSQTGTEGLDKTNTSGTTDIGFGDVGSGRDYLGQGFITDVNTITAISFYLVSKSGNSDYGYRVWIDEVNSSSEPLNGIGGIGGDTQITNANLTTGALTKYTLSSTVTVTSGTRYGIFLAPWNTNTNAHSGDYQDIRSSVSNPYADGRRVHGNTAYNSWSAPDSGNADILFETYGYNGTPLIDKVSGTDAGFANTTDGADTDPFDSGDKADYDVQITLSNSTVYYWRVKALDPSGSNAYGSFATTRSFTTVSSGGTVVKDIIGGFGIIPFSR